MARRGRAGKKPFNIQEAIMNDGLDDLAEYEKFQKELLPAIRKDLLAGISAKELLAKYQSHAAAKLLMTALTARDTNHSTAASKYIVDQASGKATENKKVTHRLEELPEDQLDSLIMSIQDEEEDNKKLDH